MVGGWRQDEDGRVHLQTVSDLSRDARKTVQHKADKLTEWLRGVRVKPRFPSPLSKG